MSRPALAAARGARIIDFLAAFPARRFSLTEIAYATEINPASCLAILGELQQRGYLCRHATRKTYWLGPALTAAGTSAALANPILVRLRATADRLHKDLHRPVLVSTQLGGQIVCLISLSGNDGRTAGLQVGERVPLLPPIGASFVAWSSPNQIDAWIERRAETGENRIARSLRETLALTRKRGFHVTLRRSERDDIASVLARAASGNKTPDFHREMTAFVEALDVEAPQPDTLDTDAAYDVQLIASPVFDPDSSATYNLCLGGFPEPLTGTTIADLGRQLAAACMEVMNA